MKDFVIEKGLLDAIGWDDLGVNFEHIIPEHINEELGIISYLDGFLIQLKSIYRRLEKMPEKGLVIDLPKYFNSYFGNSVGIGLDGLRNAKYHGSKPGDSYKHHVFVGRSGVCQGFQDEGDFFKNAEIKDIFENKIPIVEFNTKHNGYNIGVNSVIYSRSDIIKVDTIEGILYCVNLLERDE